MKQENIEQPWWLNEESETILNRGYFLAGEELEDALERICSSVAHYLGDVKDPLIKDKFKNIIRKGWMSLSSPVWANAGTDRGLPISCMGLHVNDDMGSIIAKHAETAMHTKRGAGTSGYFGDLRGRGSVITNNGESSGAVSFMRMWDTMMQVVSQGSCYVEGTEVLTDKGFKDFRDVDPTKDKIGQITKDNELIYTTVGGYELTKKQYNDDVITFKDINGSFEIAVTPNHRMMFTTDGSGFRECKAEDLDVNDTWNFHLVPTRSLDLKDAYLNIARELESLGDNYKTFIYDILQLPNDENLLSASVTRIPTELVENINVAFIKQGFSTELYKQGSYYNLVYNIKNNSVPSKYIQKQSNPYNGMVYCCIVPEGRILVRRNNRTLVCGNTRRGSFAAYLPIDHPDIEEFIRIKSIGHDIQNLFHAVCVPDYWMQEMIDGDVDKRTIWAKVLQARQQTGLPYIFFSDNVNNNKPDIYKATNSEIRHSNLCAEIALPDNANETFICCLCSINLALYDEWIKECPELPELATYFLDGVISEYINKTKDDPYMQPAHNFAVRHRAIGIGVMGWHSYLQSNMIAFESLQANLLTNKIFRHISDGTKKASEELARLLGPAPIFNEKMPDGSLYKGIKYRNTTTMAIAPTTSSSAILGQVSPGIEPYISNYYKAGLAKGNFMRRNKYLERLLKEKDQNTEAVWKSIMEHQGSVQHLDFLSDDEKAVFKTFREISQHDLITQAGIRQKYIDQSQSLNLCIPPSLPVKDVNALMIHAWQSGIKSLYYQRSVSVSKDTLSKVTVCTSCEA